MSHVRADAWLGYSTDGTREVVRTSSLGDRVLLLGQSAGPLAGLLLAAWSEGGENFLVLDLDGSVPKAASGYGDQLDHRCLLYDAFQVNGDTPVHGQLIAAAYSSALGVSADEEAVLAAGLHKLGEQGDVASPSAVYDALKVVADFKGPYVDRLKGRLGSLRHLEAAEDVSFAELAKGRHLVSFRAAPYPLAAEVAAAIFIAKAMQVLDLRSQALVVTGAHRLFWRAPRPQHRGRLLACILESGARVALASPFPALLSETVVESFPVRVYSSEAWNSGKGWREKSALPGAYVVCDDRSGRSFSFAPRYFRERPQEEVRSATGKTIGPPAVTRAVLEEVGAFEAASRRSVIAYLSPRFLEGDIAAEVDRLEELGRLTVVPRKDEGGSMMLALALTDSGKELLRELTG